MKPVLLVLLSLLAGPALAQNISASRASMNFSDPRRSASPTFSSKAIKDESAIDIVEPICPLCGEKMHQVHSDTAMINQVHHWIKIVQCKNGNKVLLIRKLPDPVPAVLFRYPR
jgi:hypothetical protein